MWKSYIGNSVKRSWITVTLPFMMCLCSPLRYVWSGLIEGKNNNWGQEPSALCGNSLCLWQSPFRFPPGRMVCEASFPFLLNGVGLRPQILFNNKCTFISATAWPFCLVRTAAHADEHILLHFLFFQLFFFFSFWIKSSSLCDYHCPRQLSNHLNLTSRPTPERGRRDLGWEQY